MQPANKLKSRKYYSGRHQHSWTHEIVFAFYSYYLCVSHPIDQVLSLSRSSHPEAFFGKRYSENMLQIYRRTLMPKYDFNKVALQLFWNCNSTRVFSFKFAAYFQNTFSQELLWMAGSTLMKRKWSLWDLGPTNDILSMAVSFEILEIKFHGKWFWNRVL